MNRNTVDILMKEITSKKAHGSKVDFSTIEITSEKTWKRCGFFDQRNDIEKVRGNDVKICRNLAFDVST